LRSRRYPTIAPKPAEDVHEALQTIAEALNRPSGPNLPSPLRVHAPCKPTATPNTTFPLSISDTYRLVPILEHAVHILDDHIVLDGQQLRDALGDPRAQDGNVDLAEIDLDVS
jgi:hypothetical protein